MWRYWGQHQGHYHKRTCSDQSAGRMKVGSFLQYGSIDNMAIASNTARHGGAPATDRRQRADTYPSSKKRRPPDLCQPKICERGGISEVQEQLIEIPACMAQEERVKLLQDASIEPFLTTDTLQELELVVIKYSIALRHDINFNYDLHFTPVSGDRGDLKRIEKEKYLQGTGYEFDIHRHVAMGGCKNCNLCRSKKPVFFRSRMRLLFYHLKNLLLHLVPKEDHQSINDNLDVDLCVQQVRHGVLDVITLANWLKSLLTNHCAPIRDSRALEMADIMKEAAREGNMQHLVLGIEKLLLFLECMRLDVANHQIRTYRPLLINEGVAFQIEYFESRIHQGRLNIDGARQWFHELCAQEHQAYLCQRDLPWTLPKSGRDVLVGGLAELCCSTVSAFPITFKHDSSRLRAIQREVQTEIHLHACSEVYKALSQHLAGQASTRSLISQRLKTILDTEETTLDYDHLPPDQISSLWSDNTPFLAIEIAQQAYRALKRPFTSIPANIIAATEKNLRQRFDIEQQQHRWAEDAAYQLRRATLHWCAIFQKMSPLEISEGQRSHQRRRHSPPARGGILDGEDSVATDTAERSRTFDLEDTARRLAHMAVLHWRIWKRLAYLDAELCREYNIDGEDVVLLHDDTADDIKDVEEGPRLDQSDYPDFAAAVSPRVGLAP